MVFENNIDSIFEPKTIFEFDISDFTKEEIEVIKVYCEKFLENLQYPHHSLKILKIPQPRRLKINDQLKIGFERLKQKDLTINNGLRLRTYIYYEKFIENKLKYIILLCKLLNYIEEYHKQHIGDPFDDTFFNNIPIRPHYNANFLLALLEDLDLIYRSTDLLTGSIVTIDLTSKGREIVSSFCPYWNFKTLMKLANDTKDSFLFESYNNIRVRIVAYNPNGINEAPEYYPINEILYFRIDFTDDDLEQKEPIFSIHNRVGLFEEILSFNDLENRLEISPFLKYNLNNYTLEFVYPVPPYFYNKNFKEKIKGNFDCARVSCADLINFIFFDHLNQYRDIEFSYQAFENIEFRGEDGSLFNITDKVNNFMGINLSALDQPNFVIVFPIKSFQFPEPKFEEIEGKKYIKFRWDVDEQYLTSFRCKTIINGMTYDIPSDGLKKEIENLNQREIVIRIQWCGDPEFFPLDNELNRIKYKNPYYQSIKVSSHPLNDKSIREKYPEVILEKQIKRIKDKICKSIKEDIRFKEDFNIVLDNLLGIYSAHQEIPLFKTGVDVSEKDFHDKVYYLLNSRLGEKIITHRKVAKGDIDFLVFNYPLDVKVEDGEQDLEKIYEKHKDQIATYCYFRKEDIGFLFVYDNTEKKKDFSTKDFNVFKEKNYQIIVLLLRGNFPYPSQIKHKK